MAGNKDISIDEFARDLKSGVIGGRMLYHMAPIMRDAGINATRIAIGNDQQMRNLFTSKNPARLNVWYEFDDVDSCNLRFYPSGAFTILERQSGVNPPAIAAAATRSSLKVAEAELSKELS